MPTQPVRKTTAMLLVQAGADYQRAITAIAEAAIQDGEAPAGTTLALDLNSPHGAVWQFPEVQPELTTDLHIDRSESA